MDGVLCLNLRGLLFEFGADPGRVAERREGAG